MTSVPDARPSTPGAPGAAPGGPTATKRMSEAVGSRSTTGQGQSFALQRAQLQAQFAHGIFCLKPDTFAFVIFCVLLFVGHCRATFSISSWG